MSNDQFADEERSPLELQPPESHKHHLSAVRPWLLILKEQLASRLENRVQENDIDLLCFCLHRIFVCVDTLHQLRWKESMDRDSTQERWADIEAAYHSWGCLVTFSQALEQLESLCQLLHNTITVLLSDLDAAPAHPIPPSAAPAPATAPTISASVISQERWDTAYTPLSQYIAFWQDTDGTARPFFTAHYRSPVTDTLSLSEMDRALLQLFYSAHSLYATVPPGFQGSALESDETTAFLLLTIGQKADLLLAQCAILLDALPDLVQQYAPGIGAR